LTAEDPKDFLHEMGWPFKERDGELIADCCMCGRANHLYMHAGTGQWICHRCGESGNIRQLRQRLGTQNPAQHVTHASAAARSAPIARPSDPIPTLDAVHRARDALVVHEPDADRARAWLFDDRMLSPDVVREASLGLMARWNQTLLAIPYVVGERVRNVKFRSIPPAEKQYRRWEGGDSLLYGAERIRGQETVLLVEGELDVLAMRTFGYDAVASTSLGARGWSEDWSRDLASAKRILVAYDQDDEGDAGATALAGKLGRTRCSRVRLPYKDAGECLRAGMSVAEMDALFNDALPMIEERVVHVSALVGGLLSPDAQDTGRRTPWPALTNLVGGLRPGDLWVVSGASGDGKSTWVTNLAYHQAADGTPAIVFPSEQVPMDVMRKMAASNLGFAWYSATQADRERAAAELATLPIYVIDRRGKIDPHALEDAVRYAVEQRMVKLVVLDHLHFFWPVRSERTSAELGEAIERIKTWTLDLGVTTVLVVQPKKTYGADVEMYDLRDAAQLYQTPDIVLVVKRRRADAWDETLLRVRKCRSDAGTTGDVLLRFSRACQDYREPPPDEPEHAPEEESSGGNWEDH